jgi:hypothetical protein
MQGIPIRGALVRESSGTVKYISRFTAHTNPNGLWNCTGVKLTVLGETLIYPVFNDVAYLGKNYEAPNLQYDEPLKDDGKVVPWTPRRILLYMQLLANVSENDSIPGIYADSGWRSIGLSDRLYWFSSSVDSISSSELLRTNDNRSAESSDIDPLDRKMPDVSFQGKTMLNAMNDVLAITGTHGIVVDPVYITSVGIASELQLYSRFPPVPKETDSNVTDPGTGLPADENASIEPTGKTLKLQRKGDADIPGSDTIFDFTVLEDSSNTFESVLVEGKPVYVETELSYDPDDTANSSLKPAWTADEEKAFKYIIYGATSDNDDTYEGKCAISVQDWGVGSTFDNYIDSSGNTQPRTWVNADGLAYPNTSELKPFVKARTPQAVALARATFPKVFKCFYIDSTKIKTALYGANSEYTDETKYPILDYKRPILSDQLQYILNELTSGDNIENWLKANYPVRVQVNGPKDDGFHDSVYQSGIRVTADGLIWLDSICESVNGADECVYDDNLLLSAPLSSQGVRIQVGC